MLNFVTYIQLHYACLSMLCFHLLKVTCKTIMQNKECELKLWVVVLLHSQYICIHVLTQRNKYTLSSTAIYCKNVYFSVFKITISYV